MVSRSKRPQWEGWHRRGRLSMSQHMTATCALAVLKECMVFVSVTPCAPGKSYVTSSHVGNHIPPDVTSGADSFDY